MKENKLLSNLIWGLILVGIIFLIIFSLNYDKSFSEKAQGNVQNSSSTGLFVSENNFNFNKISMMDGSVNHRFEVKNEGTETVFIEKIYTSCMCTTAVVINGSGDKYGVFGMPGHKLPAKTSIEIKGGESVTVEATFNPSAHGPSGVGLAQRSIYLETNSVNSPKVELRFQALVTK